VAFDQLLARMADKWREVPGGTDQHPRQFSDDLLKGSDDELASLWARQFEQAASLRGWYWTLYSEILRGKRVIEIGSGLGFDAVHLATCGARVVCCDIASSNLEIIRRIADQRRLDIETLPIEGLRSFDRLPHDVDAIWAIGSIHHMPFDEAREESHAIVTHLKPGGRWIELGYPRERWVREGAPPFAEWGMRTDGDRTPWAEWYDVEKLKLRLHPWRLEPIFEHRHQSDTYVWMDCRLAGPGPAGEIRRRTVRAPLDPITAPGPIWNYAWRAALGPSPAGSAVTVEIECVVEEGSVGFVLRHGSQDRFISREVIVEARTGSQRLYLTTDAYEPDTLLLTRSATALGESRYFITSIDLRQAL
jgi:SAM-dependent methyltransferase